MANDRTSEQFPQKIELVTVTHQIESAAHRNADIGCISRLDWERVSVCGKMPPAQPPEPNKVVYSLVLRDVRSQTIIRMMMLVFFVEKYRKVTGKKNPHTRLLEYVDTFNTHFNTKKCPKKFYKAYLELCAFSKDGSYGVAVI